MPVEPNPPLPLVVLSKSSTSMTSGITILSRMSCATRSPALTAKSWSEWLKMESGPYINGVLPCQTWPRSWHNTTTMQLGSSITFNIWALLLSAFLMNKRNTEDEWKCLWMYQSFAFYANIYIETPSNTQNIRWMQTHVYDIHMHVSISHMCARKLQKLKIQGFL